MDYSFKKLLGMPFNSVAEEYEGVIQVDSMRHIINIKGISLNDSLSNNSDVIVFYDIVGDGQPLMVIERIDTKQWKSLALRKRVREMKEFVKEKFVVTVVRNKKGFVDITLIKRSVYDKLSKKT